MPRHLVHAAMALALAACSDADPAAPVCEGKPAPCACAKAADCGPLGRWGCVQQVCRALCRSASDCAAGEFCEVGICRAAACGTDDECAANGEVCLAGSCKPPVADAAVKSCDVLPMRALLHEGAARPFAIFARDEKGRGIPWRGTVEWSTDQPARATTAGGRESATVTGGAEEGRVFVNATLPGGVACTASIAENYPKVRPGKLRVVVADLMSSLPIRGARVVATGGLQGETDGRGVVTFDVEGDTRREVSVFERLHAWVTYAGVRSRDLVVFAKPLPSRAGFTGTFAKPRFDALSVPGETTHVAFFGSSIPANLLDLQVATLFGNLLPTDVRLGSTDAKILLPSGVVFGIGADMFREGYDVFAPPGLRTVWGIGGNASFSTLFSALAPILLADGTVATGKLLGSLLPLVNRMQLGVTTGLRTPFTTDLDPIDVKLDTPLRRRVLASVPALPTWSSGDATRRLEGAIAVGGALAPGQGFVPLGISAALDEGADGLVDASDEEVAPGVLPLRLAPLSAGLETARSSVVVLATSFSKLGLGGQEDVAEPLVFSGIVKTLPGLAHRQEGVPVSFERGFLGIPDAPALRGRTFTRTAPVVGSTFSRLDVGSAWGGEWYVFLPDDLREWTLPQPPDGFTDRLDPTDPAEPVEILLQSARLAGEPLSFEDLAAFDAVNFDDLGDRLEAFSTREILRPGR